MTSIFLGKKMMRQEYYAALATQIAGGSLANPYLVAVFQRGARMYSIKNTTDTALRLFLVNPEDDSGTPLFWLDLDPGETLGGDLTGVPMQWEIPAQTHLLCTGVTLAGAQATPSLGRIKIISWG
jgi:hypothetical protein